MGRIEDLAERYERHTLREKLSNFVCEGQYADGTLRILESFLGQLGGTSQPAAWVSGFYGSGKSHLLKILCHLWADIEFSEDGARARSLVPDLPADVAAALKELDTQGRRLGGLHAASGTLPAGGGESVRLTVLGILLKDHGEYNLQTKEYFEWDKEFRNRVTRLTNQEHEVHNKRDALIHDVGAGATGRDIRKKFADSPFGWPQDAIDGALIALHATGHLTAKYQGNALNVWQLDQNKVARTEFRVETATLSAKQKIKLRGLFQEAGLSAKASDDLVEKSSEFLDTLEHLAEHTGGEAPLPQRPSVSHLADLRSLAGNERLVKMLDEHDTLKANAKNWKAAMKLTEKRTPVWERLERFATHGRKLPEFSEIELGRTSILDGRLLLDGTDHVTPLVKKAAGVLRSAVKATHKQFADTHAAKMKTLQANQAWQGITDDQRQQFFLRGRGCRRAGHFRRQRRRSAPHPGWHVVVVVGR